MREAHGDTRVDRLMQTWLEERFGDLADVAAELSARPTPPPPAPEDTPEYHRDVLLGRRD